MVNAIKSITFQNVNMMDWIVLKLLANSPTGFKMVFVMTLITMLSATLMVETAAWPNRTMSIVLTAIVFLIVSKVKKSK